MGRAGGGSSRGLHVKAAEAAIKVVHAGKVEGLAGEVETGSMLRDGADA